MVGSALAGLTREAVTALLPEQAGVWALIQGMQLVEAAIAVTNATAADGPEQVPRLLTSRAIIEQAKGAIVAATGFGSPEAWRMLRETSQNHNVKLRELAVALVEYLGNEPVEQPSGLSAATGDERAGEVARAMWRQLATHDRPPSAGSSTLVGQTAGFDQ